MEVAPVDLSEFAPLGHVVVKDPRAAFGSDQEIASQWHHLGYSAPPGLDGAQREHDRFVDLLTESGATVHRLPPDQRTGLDSIYVRDATIVCSTGIILCEMGKALRAAEPPAQAESLHSLGVPDAVVVGKVRAPGRIEGGDVIWLDQRTLAIGVGYRTNADGIRQVRELLDGSVEELIEVPLPHWRGPRNVLHLMSLISPVDADLAAVYSPLLPVPFRERLLARGMRLVEVPDAEFDTMGTNVLALAPRKCIMLEGNPRTREALVAAGADVTEYVGHEISMKGAGGPTCLTRPLTRGRQ